MLSSKEKNNLVYKYLKISLPSKKSNKQMVKISDRGQFSLALRDMKRIIFNYLLTLPHY